MNRCYFVKKFSISLNSLNGTKLNGIHFIKYRGIPFVIVVFCFLEECQINQS